METTPDLRPILDYLDDLSHNNAKAWFDANRPAYEAARAAFARYVDRLIDGLRDSDELEDLSAADCIYRINRDIRFSKDKTPYKTNLSAYIAPGGRKSMRQGCYVCVAPRGGSMVAGGLHTPTPRQLAGFRQAIDRDAAAFRRIVEAEGFAETFGPVEGERLKKAPQGYDTAHPDIDLLRLKQVLAMRRFSDEEVLAPGFPDQALAACRAMRPFLDYLDAFAE